MRASATNKRLHGELAVAEDSDGRVDDTSNLPWLNIEVDKPSATLLVCLLCLWRVSVTRCGVRHP